MPTEVPLVADQVASFNAADAVRGMDFEAVKRIIPQRFPFLMLDRIIEVRPGISAIGLKNLTGNEWFYQGHFPKRAVTPGAMITEAVAQTGIVFFHCSRDADAERDVTYLLGAVRMRFLEPVWPGDQLRMEVAAIKMLRESAMLSVRALVEDRVVAKGELSLSAKPNRQL